jgi:hypothetical protein
MIKITATTQVINKNTGKVEQTITETYTGYLARKYLNTTINIPKWQRTK